MSKFVCKDVLPPRGKNPTARVMYGGWDGADTDSRRVCKICHERPILRHVKGSGFCKQHLMEAWSEQAKYPMELEWLSILQEYQQ